MKKFNQEKLVQEAKSKFGAEFWIKQGSEWSEGTILWTGEGAIMPDGLPVFNYYSEDYKEVIYQMGVHKDFVKWLDSKGLFAEPNDAGTLLVYRV
jgi:hypothetical protein